MTEQLTQEQAMAKLKRMDAEEKAVGILREALDLDQVEDHDRKFIRSLCDNLDKWGNWTDKQYEWAQKMAQKYSGMRQESLPLGT